MINVVLAGAQHAHYSYFGASLAERSDARLVGLSEPDPAVRERVAAELGVPAYADHQELIERHQPDVVGIAPEFGARGQIALDALAAGCHVLADKPLCTTLEELDAIVAAQARADRHVSVMFEKRGYEPSARVRKLVDDGVLGDITLVHATGPHKLNEPTRPDWFWQRKTYGGILNDLVVHDIDMFLWLTGARQGVLTGFSTNAAQQHHPEFADAGLVALKADSGAMASLEANWMSPAAAPWHGDYRMRVTGTLGTAELGWRANELWFATHTAEPELIKCGPAAPPAKYFFDALTAGAEPDVSTADSLAATRLALLAQQSADTGTGDVPWNLDENGNR
ncbi:Gfo/Idh/MocA family protein [Propionibacteriaceae bacterium Y1700]|uniref:Gfo/Idh/MocA family protein n=1 Tax=Microlunatus sp. Y1700 TaxID=3418487 RepID=UPI003DA72BA9